MARKTRTIAEQKKLINAQLERVKAKEAHIASKAALDKADADLARLRGK